MSNEERDAKYQARLDEKNAKKPQLERQPSSEFMDMVQAHERTWGVKSYVGKPSLEELLTANIVIFWREEGKKAQSYTVTLHKTYREIEILMFKMLFRQPVTDPRKRPVRMFSNRKRFVVKNVSIEFTEVED